MIHAPRQRNLASFDEAGLKVDKHGASFVQNDGLGLGEFVEFWHDLQDSVGAALHHVQEVRGVCVVLPVVVKRLERSSLNLKLEYIMSIKNISM